MRERMLRILSGAVVTLAGLLTAFAETPQATPGGVLLYECEKPGTGYRDVVSLRTGEKRIGKSLEWGTRVFVYDPSGRRWEAAASQLQSIEIRRDAAVTTRPAQPDLTVAYVERGGDAGGSSALKIHVLNAGGAAAKPFDYRVGVDGKTTASGRVEQPMAAGDERVVEARAEMPKDGAGDLRIELDVKNENTEIVRWNNTFVEPLVAEGVHVQVGKEQAEGMRSVRNLVDSFCAEDWLQFHVRTMNELFQRSAYPSVPGGIARRLRIQGVSKVATQPAGDEQSATAPAGTGAGAGVAVVLPPFRAGGSVVDAANRVDWELCRQIGKALGLIDLARLESTVEQCMVRDGAGDFVQREYRLPDGELLMRGPGAGLLSELDALFLNSHPEPTKARGDYLKQLPKRCGLIVLDSAGRPMAGVDVTIFQRGASDSGVPTIPDQAVVLGETDSGGRFPLPARESADAGGSPSPWGSIEPDGSNGLFLVRLRKNGAVEYRFVSILDFCLAAARRAESFDLPISTLFGGASGTDAPRFVRAKYFYDEPCSHECMIQFPAGKNTESLEYRIFAMEGRSATEWTLVDLVPLDHIGHGGVASETVGIEPLRGGGLSGGTAFTALGVDKQGGQGWFAPPRYTPSWRRESVSLAVIPESRPGIVLFSRQGPLDHGLVKSNFNQFHDDYGIRTTRFPGYEPWGGGMAFDERKRLIMTDPRNHQVGWYEQAELVQLVGNPARGPGAASKKEGEFDTPSDVAVDEKGRVYIADTANDRVQQLDTRGGFVRLFKTSDAKPEDAFVHPTALGYSYGRLCVTDRDGQRVQVFDVSGDEPNRVRNLTQLRGTNRALAGASGRIYVLGQDTSEQDAVLIYPIEPNAANGVEQPERSVRRLINGFARGPRGFYPDGTGNAFYVTTFPFIVQRFTLE